MGGGVGECPASRVGGSVQLWSREKYRWFLPLLRMDTVPKFGQLIKLVQAEVGMGSTRVRRPRLELIGNELEQAKHTIREALRARPEPVGSYALPNWK